MADGYQVRDLDLESDWKPGHQFSRIFAPIGDLAQNMINPEIVTMKYYDVHFNTRQGFRYDCVAAIGNNGQLKDGAKYVEIKDRSVGTDDEGSFLKPQLVQVKN